MVVMLTSKTFLTEPLFYSPPSAINVEFDSIEVTSPKHSKDLNWHYHYATKFFERPQMQFLLTGLCLRQDEKFKECYSTFAKSEDPIAQDIGNMGLVVMHTQNDNLRFAEEALQKFTNQKHPFALERKAYITYRTGNYEEALKQFKEVLALNDTLPFARGMHIKLAVVTRNYNDLTSYTVAECRKNLDKSTQRDVWLATGQYGVYLTDIFKHIPYKWITFLSSLLVALVWLYYFIKASAFVPVNYHWIMLTFTTSLLCTFLCLLPYDILSTFLNFTPNDNVLNDLLYCILGIGVIEESAKLAPVLLIMLLNRKINDPIHILWLGVASALGFSFLENQLYFYRYNETTIYTRAILSVPLHLFCTLIIVYGIWIKDSTTFTKPNLKNGLFLFVLSILFHGLFDAILINPYLENFYLLALSMSIFAYFGIARMWNYALNLSSYFENTQTFKNKAIREYLIWGISATYLTAFTLGAIENGYHASFDIFVSGILTFIAIMIFLILGLSDFHLVKGYAIGLFDKISRFQYDELLQKKAEIHPTGKSKTLTSIISGISLHRIHRKGKGHLLLFKAEPNEEENSWFVLNPFKTEIKKGIKVWKSNLFSVPNAQRDIEPEDFEKTKSLGMVEIIMPEAPIIKFPIYEKIGAGIYYLFFFLCFWILWFYMNYTSARTAYGYALDWLQHNEIAKAGQNLDYAIHKDKYYTEALLMEAEVSLLVNDKSGQTRFLDQVKPRTNAEKATVEYLIGKFHMLNGDTTAAKKQFTLCLENPLIKDSAEKRINYIEKINRPPVIPFDMPVDSLGNVIEEIPFDTSVYTKLENLNKMVKD